MIDPGEIQPRWETSESARSAALQIRVAILSGMVVAIESNDPLWHPGPGESIEEYRDRLARLLEHAIE